MFAEGADGNWSRILDGLTGCVAGFAYTRIHVGESIERAHQSLENAPASPPAAAAGDAEQSTDLPSSLEFSADGTPIPEDPLGQFVGLARQSVSLDGTPIPQDFCVV